MVRPRTDLIVVHCSATEADEDIGAEEIRAWHRARGWNDIGYHFVIRRNGTVEGGRDITHVGAHAKGFNWKSIGVCLAGGGRHVPERNFTHEQWDSLRGLLGELVKTYPEATVLGHRDLPNVSKACPTFDAGEWWRSQSASD